VQRRLTTSENRHELARILGPIGIALPRNRQEADELIEAIEAELGRRDAKGQQASNPLFDSLPTGAPSRNLPDARTPDTNPAPSGRNNKRE
jgi:transposase